MRCGALRAAPHPTNLPCAVGDNDGSAACERGLWHAVSGGRHTGKGPTSVVGAAGTLKSPVHLSLYIPRLLDIAPTASTRPAPELARLLADAAVIEAQADGAIAALASMYGIERQHDWPLAALRVASLGLDAQPRYWLRATPVLLEAGRDDVRVAGAVEDLDEGEARTVLDTLSRHFAGDGIMFMAGTPRDWFVACDHAPSLRTHPLALAIGQRVRPHLPEGEDAGQWRRWSEEIEMLLHDHPVNVARERDGRMIVNALWWQHGGVLPARTVAQPRTYSDDDDLRALAHHVGVPAHAVPENVLEALQDPSTAEVVMSSPADSTLADMEARFAAPLSRTLHAGRVQTIDVIADGIGKPALRWRVMRKGWMRHLLRRPLSLADVIGDALRATV